MPLARDKDQQVVQAMRPSTNQEVTVTATSAATATTFTKNIVRLCASVDCRVVVGSAPTALSTSMRLPAGIVEYIAVYPGEKLAAIRESVDGVLTVTEMD